MVALARAAPLRSYISVRLDMSYPGSIPHHPHPHKSNWLQPSVTRCVAEKRELPRLLSGIPIKATTPPPQNRKQQPFKSSLHHFTLA